MTRNIVVDGMLDGVMVLNTKDWIIDLNKSVQAILGMTINEALGKAAKAALPVWQEIEEQAAQKKEI